MDLAQLIKGLKDLGNQLNSWDGVETNVESISNLIEVDDDYRIELKLRNSWKHDYIAPVTNIF